MTPRTVEDRLAAAQRAYEWAKDRRDWLISKMGAASSPDDMAAMCRDLASLEDGILRLGMSVSSLRYARDYEKAKE